MTCGKCHYIATDDNENVYFWGQSGNGSKDDDLLHQNKPELNILLSDLKIIRIERGAHHTLALTQTRDVYSWGMNEDGQVGVEREKDWQLIPIKIEGFVDQKILQISCGYYSMSLTESGHVFSWGNNEFGKLGWEMKKIHLRLKLSN
jgi:alpha-tubulin suppressor-like RCC1 family protein